MKALLTSALAVVFLTLPMGVAAQENWPDAITIPTGFEERAPTGEWSLTANGCQVWNVTPRPTGTINWTGECVAGRVHGKGTIDYENGNLFRGSFENGKENGEGTFYSAGGDRYKGGFRDGKEDGLGTIDFVSGDKFVGQFKGGKMNGRGTYYWDNGNQHEGEYKDDMRHGQGKFIWADGRQYDGEYRNDKRNGYSVYTRPDGSRYEGSFRNGLASDGSFFFANGHVTLSHQTPNGQWVLEPNDRRIASARIEDMSESELGN
jgi:hypothetical protein